MILGVFIVPHLELREEVVRREEHPVHDRGGGLLAEVMVYSTSTLGWVGKGAPAVRSARGEGRAQSCLRRTT